MRSCEYAQPRDIVVNLQFRRVQKKYHRSSYRVKIIQTKGSTEMGSPSGPARKRARLDDLSGIGGSSGGSRPDPYRSTDQASESVRKRGAQSSLDEYLGLRIHFPGSDRRSSNIVRIGVGSKTRDRTRTYEFLDANSSRLAKGALQISRQPI